MAALRRIEEALPLNFFFGLRETLRARRHWPERQQQFEAIAARRNRERIFIVGNAPSLRSLDLDRLDGEDYLLCNMAEHLSWAQGRTHPYYLAADTGVPEKYRNGRPDLAAKQYFFAQKLRNWLDSDFSASAPIFWFAPAKGGILKRGMSVRPWISIPAGQTILVIGAQIAWALGYRSIYIIGCDLDYSGPDPYAYRTTEVERERAKRDDRRMVERTNAQFAVLRRSIEAGGGVIANAGTGGRLDSLPRIPFATLFP